MQDQHVDRLGVEVQQCMELTSTNCSIGLIVKLVCSVKRIAFAHTWASKRHFGFILHYTLLISADPVVMAGGPHPIPSRTRSLSPLALMVLRLKARESKSLPGPQKSVSIMPLADTNLSFTSRAISRWPAVTDFGPHGSCPASAWKWRAGFAFQGPAP